jgi:DNA-binding transcriptional MerR regulator
MDPVIPDKMYFKIGEVSEITGLEAHVLRFWESEFKNIKPRRTSTGQRMYRKEDIQLVLYIKHLLHNEKFTIQGARKHIEQESSASKNNDPKKISLDIIKSELQEILDMLDD